MIQEPIKFVIYCRKSSESEDRQVQSIDDQKRLLSDLAARQGLKDVEICSEARSAKTPDNRPIFNSLMERVERGEVQGIICWQINRLSRNPVDSGRIQWLLQQGILRVIQTPERQYRPEDNVLLFSMESGMANQFILDLKKNVKRGITSKLEKGWRPGMAPTGYLNKLDDHTIIPDPERFVLVRKAWDLMLSNTLSVPRILYKLNHEWGFRTLPKRRSGNRPLAQSALYHIFTNPFYAGSILHLGELYPGKHQPMVTLDEFDRVQYLLGRKGRPRFQKHEFAYTGMILCGECGCRITAEKKTKFIKQSKTINSYTYYRCTHKKAGYKCHQKTITVQDLEAQISNRLSEYTIHPKFRAWALEVLNRENDKEIQERSTIYENQQRSIVAAENQIDSLTKMRYRELITDEEYLKQRNELQEQLNTLKRSRQTTEQRTRDWRDLAEQIFNFITYAKDIFDDPETDLMTKKCIFNTLGSNYVLTDRKLQIDEYKWLQVIRTQYPALKTDMDRLELNKALDITAKTAAVTAVFTRWQGR